MRSSRPTDEIDPFPESPRDIYISYDFSRWIFASMIRVRFVRVYTSLRSLGV